MARRLILAADAEKDLKLVHTAVTMAHGLGLRVVAEGGETKAQLTLLEDMGCDTAQGYLFTKAVPAIVLSQLLSQSEFFSLSET